MADGLYAVMVLCCFPRDHVRWCCQTFGSHWKGAGRRGLGIVIEQTDAGPTFLIQCRSIDPSDEQAFKAINTAFPVSFVTQTGLLFCPWCGKNLRRQYGRHAKDLSRLDLSIPLCYALRRAESGKPVFR